MKSSEAFKPKPSKIMNETTPPSLGATSQPKTSALAIWSLALGILGVVLVLACLGVLFAIPGVICGHIAYSRIKRSSGALAGEGMAIAGLITGYVSIGLSVFMLPMLMAIAIPNFVKARETAQMNACINNLRQIDAAKNEWALENGKTGDAVPTVQDLTPYMRNGIYTGPNHTPNTSGSGIFPTCPAGGTYTLGAVSNAPTCSIPGHKFQ